VATGLASAGGQPPGDAGGPPAQIALPDGFQPEGIAIGAEPVAFFGSLANGAIFRVDLATGRGEVIGEPPGTPSANGIVLAPDGETLIIVQTNTGLLFTLDPVTGQTARTGVVDVAGDGLLPNGDGLLVVGQTLFVVQNRLNALAVLEINGTGSQADLVDRLSDERFDVPTTVAAFEDLLYLPNARFGIEATPETEYNAVAIARP
jgi:hypothetical protein